MKELIAIKTLRPLKIWWKDKTQHKQTASDSKIYSLLLNVNAIFFAIPWVICWPNKLRNLADMYR